VTSVVGKYDPKLNGYTAEFVGQATISEKDFAKRIQKHIEMFKATFSGKGLLSYTAYVTKDHESAITQWKSEADMNSAFKKYGKEIEADAGQFLKSVIWKELKPLPKALDDSYFKDLLN
jgi:hypothetical protein